MLSRRGALLLAAGSFALLSPPVRRPPKAAPAVPPPVRPQLEALLTARSAALLRRDGAALTALAAPEAVPGELTLLARLAELPLAGLGYRLTGVGEPTVGGGESGAAVERVSATAELGYRVDGVDAHPALLGRRVEFVRSGGRWLLASDEPAGAVALWDLGAVRVVRGARSTVLGLGEPGELAKTAALADHAVPAVSEVWGSGWAGRLLLEIPASEEQFAQLLGVKAADYQGIAAVTTAATGPDGQSAADRVVLNPEAYAELTDLGRRVVTTHEATHVATRADTRAWTPLWLSEGVADYTGYRSTGRTPRQIAPELAKDVQAGRLPAALPLDSDFTAGAVGIAQAYELGWSACRLIAERYGEPRLTAFYRAAGAAGPTASRDQWLDGLLRAQLGVGLDAFVKEWVAELKRLFGG
ncbi:hypothetical protein ABT095_16870 [Kitasatospora sp. NPDC002227]|uniref:hypothetical protein n=1 Tax=Kitasatospora sp. NPDC002227 TaxID=3154773 RepID=UPI00332AB750